MILRLALATFVIGIALQITAYKKRNIKLMQIGFAIYAGPAVVNSLICMQIPHYIFNIIGFCLLVITWLNWIIVKRLEQNNFCISRRQKNKMLAHIRVVGTKENVADYFDYYGLEMTELVAEEDGRYSSRHKVYLDRLPIVRVLNGFVLDINPKEGKPGRWQFQFGTRFGTNESHIYDVIDIFIRYDEPEEIYHHSDFQGGKVWIHIIDFHPIGWKFAG